MKSQERHKLKENELAQAMSKARVSLEGRQRDITWGIGIVLALLVAVGGYTWWRQAQTGDATQMLASALAIYEAPVIPAAAPAPGSAPPVQQPGTYMTQQAKLEAALPKFVEAADRYPNNEAGVTARYYAAGILATLGRFSEAEQRYQEVVSKAGNTLYGRTARLGLAEVQVAQRKYDNAINIYTELSRDTNSQMPVDGLLMQLGRAYAKAGKKDDAVRTFTRVTSEFPQSPYLDDAKRELEEARKS